MPVLAAEDDVRGVLLELDLAAGREAHADERRTHALPDALLGQEQEVVGRPAEDDERRDHARLRREEQRLARVAHAELLDVVRDHRLEVCLGSRASHPNEVAGAGGYAQRRDSHRH